MKPIHATCATLALLTTGCFQTLPIDKALYRDQLTRTFQAPVDKCYDATLKALADIKTPVEKADPATRTIWSGRGVVFEGAQGGSGYAMRITDEHRISLQIDGDSSQCTVRTTKYEIWHNQEKLNQLNATWSKAHIWDPFFQAIDDHLDRGL